MSEFGELSFTPPRGMSVKDVDQYFGVWAIESKRAGDIWATLQTYDFSGTQMAARDFDVERSPRGSRIAHVSITGVMTKRGSSLSDAGSTVAARRAITQAADDPKVDGIMLHIESPGGSVAGTAELGDAIHAAREQKPVVAYIEDIGASAAYWAASQAGHVFANRSAEVGSIGVFMVVADQSRFADDMGVKVHVIKAGEFKGAGTPGTEITEAQLAEFQRRIDTTFDQFVEVIDRGRAGLNEEQIRELADGRVHSAPAAVDRGLIDGVKSEQEALAFLEDLIMSQQTSDAPKAATLPELRSALVGADSEFLLECLSASMSMEDAKDHWILSQSEQLAAIRESRDAAVAESGELKEKVAALQGENEKLKKRHTGVEPIGSGKSSDSNDNSGESARETFRAMVDKEVESGTPRQRAVSKVSKANPDLRERMIEETNAAAKLLRKRSA